MINSEEQGMKSYAKILQSIRNSNKLAGSKHHLYNKHFLKWCEGKTEEEINLLISSNKKKAKTPVKKNATGKKKMTKVKTKTKLSEADLRKKMHREWKNKLASKWIGTSPTDHIKSVGNGL